jgi:hypothetical protein
VVMQIRCEIAEACSKAAEPPSRRWMSNDCPLAVTPASLDFDHLSRGAPCSVVS